MRSDNLTREEARIRAGLVWDLHYEVALDMTGDDESFGCETTIRFSGRAGSSTFIDYASTQVTGIVLNGRTIDTASCDGARIPLESLEATNELKIEARSQYSKTGFGMHHFEDPADGLVYTYSDSEPFQAHRSFPCFDQPDLKGTFEFSVNARPEWRVLSNSAPASRPQDGKPGVWKFETTPPLAPYFAVIVAGPYEGFTDRHGPVELGLYSRRSMAAHLEPDEIFEITKQGFDYYERVFSRPYQFGKYDQVYVPEFIPGAMENAGCITINEQMLFRHRVTETMRERRAEFILHELAHMWFGDLVTLRWWDDLWLNESFATLMAFLSMEQTRFKQGWSTFHRRWKYAALELDQLPTTHPIAADIPDILASHSNFDAITYAKGAAVLRQLFAFVGEKKFYAGLSQYFSNHEFGNADLGEFTSALESSSGLQLNGWMDEWIGTAGINTLATQAKIENGKYASLSIKQSAQPGQPLRNHLVPVGLYQDGPGGLELARRIEVEVTGSSTDVEELKGEGVPDLLLLNDADSAYCKVQIDQSSTPVVRDKLSRISDPLVRALVWGSMWEAVRDASAMAGELVDLVVLHGPSETNAGILETLLLNTYQAATLFGADSNRGSSLERLADTALASIDHIDEGSDQQLVWADGLTMFARRAGHLQVLEGWLANDHAERGLVVTQDLRWKALLRLAAAGKADQETIEAEVQRDQTEEGSRRAMTVRAACPSLDSKAAAWKEVLKPSAKPVHIAAVGLGFHISDQEELSRPYVDRYLTSLGDIWAERPNEVARAFSLHMFPKTLPEEDVIEKVSAHLEANQLDPPLKRFLIEGRHRLVLAHEARIFAAMS